MPASGCNCSGYQNSHGFGASCKGWEFEGQNPWCYVEPACKGDGGGSNGSFGQPYEDCYESWPGQSFPQAFPPTDNLAPSPSPPPPPPPDSSVLRTAQPSQLLQPRSGCACSGYKNAHGFGAACQGWDQGWGQGWGQG